MFYAAVIVCWQGACWALTDNESPHATEAACLARLDAMRAAVTVAFQHRPGARMRAFCAPLDELRRHIPGAFPGHIAEVLL